MVSSARSGPSKAAPITSSVAKSGRLSTLVALTCFIAHAHGPTASKNPRMRRYSAASFNTSSQGFGFGPASAFCRLIAVAHSAQGRKSLIPVGNSLQAPEKNTFRLKSLGVPKNRRRESPIWGGEKPFGTKGLLPTKKCG